MLVITFREDRPATESVLREWNIPWTRLVTSTLDACLAVGVDQWKASECRKAGVDDLFEDDPDVLRHVDPTTLCLQPYVRSEPEARA